MSKKITVGVLFGGDSVEHQVSLLSAKNIVDAIDKNKFDVVLIGIDQQGKWLYQADASDYLLEAHDPSLIRLNQSTQPVTFVPGADEQQLTHIHAGNTVGQKIDVVFPVLHGANGEDGTVQGLLRLAGIPFVGSDVAASAVCMDKDLCKRLCRDAGIPISNFITIHAHEKARYQYDQIVSLVGSPFFIKPANSGSSVGIEKVSRKDHFKEKYENAFLYDNKVVIEQAIEGRELECAVLGNDEPIASLAGEVLTTHEFYSYTAKYLDDKGTSTMIPADLPERTLKDLQAMAIETFKILGCSGMARVDFFLTKSGELLINEVNTIPGFTNISMYPKLWDASGIGYSELIERLIHLALERDDKRAQLLTRYQEFLPVK